MKSEKAAKTVPFNRNLIKISINTQFPGNHFFPS